MEQTIKLSFEQVIVQIRRDNEELNRKLRDTGDDVSRQRA
jgi:hypothetical protein